MRQLLLPDSMIRLIPVHIMALHRVHRPVVRLAEHRVPLLRFQCLRPSPLRPSLL